MKLSRPEAFLSLLAAVYLIPLAIPNVGLDYQYFFIMVIVLSAWFLLKWQTVNSIDRVGRLAEIFLGGGLIAGDYLLNFLRSSSVGIADLTVIFLGTVLIAFGLRSLKLFWVPAAYGVVLLAGYQIEAYTPNFVSLQYWLAGLMASSLSAMGISAVASGTIVTLSSSNGPPLQLQVASVCTGLQGILAFGMLSTMTLIDFRPRFSRLVPIFALGFLGAFLINILRLLVVFLTFVFLGEAAGITMHVYFGYLVFVGWVLVFWAIAFKYLVPPVKSAQIPVALSLQPR